MLLQLYCLCGTSVTLIINKCNNNSRGHTSFPVNFLTLLLKKQASRACPASRSCRSATTVINIYMCNLMYMYLMLLHDLYGLFIVPLLFQAAERDLNKNKNQATVLILMPFSY